MKITNPDNLPQQMFDAINRGRRLPEARRFHVTQLIAPPKIRVLRMKHDDEVEMSATSLLMPLLGTAFHHYMEIQPEGPAGAHGLVEKEVKVGGEFIVDGESCTVVGMYDRRENGVISDYKVTSVWSVIFSDKDWEEQLNVYRYLAEDSGSIHSLEVIAFLRDWRNGEKFKRGYPQFPQATIPIPVWDDDRAYNYIMERLRLHLAAEKQLPECTENERWASPPKYAVMKKGRKSAVRVLDTEEAAVEFMQGKGLTNPTHWIDVREPISKRCADYCSVSKFCEQAKREFGE